MTNRIYCRVSTIDQSYDQQMMDIKAYFQARGMDISAVEDIACEKVSGGKSYEDRELKSLLKRCKAGDNIFVASTDRLGRNFSDMVKLMEEAKKRGIIITACKQNISLADDNSTAKIILAIMAIIDEDERKRISHRTANKKAFHKEQIREKGYFIIEKGENAGAPCTYIGRPKKDKMSQAQYDAMVRMNIRSASARHESAQEWLRTSLAVKFVKQKAAAGWGCIKITEALGELYDLHSGEENNPYATPRGKRPQKGNVSTWLRLDQ